MSAVRVVGSEVACAGFALAGLTTHDVSSPREAGLVLEELVRRDDVGVLLVEQAVLSGLGAEATRELTRRPAPIMVPFPSPAWREDGKAPESLVLELLQRAIGYRVRL